MSHHVKLVIELDVRHPDAVRRAAFDARQSMWNDVDSWIDGHNGEVPMHELLFELILGSTPSDPSMEGFEIDRWYDGDNPPSDTP